MQKVINKRLAGWGLAALMTLTAAGGSAACSRLVGPARIWHRSTEADMLISITQTQESILWSSLAGNVSAVEIVGWPVADGTHELGGALMIEKPANPLAGAMRTGEKPASAKFSFGE